MKPLKIIADENIYQVTEIFGEYGDVQLLTGRDISPDHLKDADVLLVRSVTKVNQTLLEGSSVKFVASATIGVDHIDQTYLASQGIRFAFAPGCNANAVVQYVFSVLANLAKDWQNKTFGIIGCGNVGGTLYKTLNALGVSCRCYDPFLNDIQQGDLTTLNHVLKADIISLHTPLTHHSDYPSYHLITEQELNQLKDGALLINSGRGAVINNQALTEALKTKRFKCALDVWEDEPEISSELMSLVDIATSHIAGYSLDGKHNGTAMIFNAFVNWLGIDKPLGEQPAGNKPLFSTSINQAILDVYDVKKDDSLMRDSLNQAGNQGTGQAFDQLRKEYDHRLEFHHYQVPKGLDQKSLAALRQLGFNS